MFEYMPESKSEDMSGRARELACQVMTFGHIRDLIITHLADSLGYYGRKMYLMRCLTFNKDYASSIIKALWAKAYHERFSEMAIVCDPVSFSMVPGLSPT